MPTNHRRELARIKRFDQLVAYLRDEMDWPIEGEDFEDLTFEYSPEELGIDAQNAAKIQEIKRLRPLTPDQPWGIFFVKFEPKRLPVMALRRILSRVVLKKQAAANSAERAAWQMADLLFISNHGGEEERRISFAHFVQDAHSGDLPTLKVLGWDEDDTGLHLDHVAAQLTRKLRWPEDEADIETWRQTWAGAFTLRNREVITTSKRLAEALAALARATYAKMREALAIEAENGPLRTLMDGFKKALIHDLDEDGFADMYAQTIAYGLLSARISRQSGFSFIAENMSDMVPVTNPFLKEMLESFLKLGGRRRSAQSATGIDFDELGINEMVELLRDANMEAVVRDFGDKNPEEDPVIHFYEDFIALYDPKRRKQRGIFYTPRPVVSYIVRSVDELLRTEFGLEDGLADTTTWGEMAARHADLTIPEGVSPDQAFVQILDVATGTGTFIVEVIELIHRTMVAKWKAQGHRDKQIVELWNEYVPKHLLPRVHGYELLMAPYAIAHLKIGLKLYETGYRFESDERARVYLTNALEPARNGERQMEFQELMPALAHEASAVNKIKIKKRFTVVIGNPPYSNYSQLNSNSWILRLLDDYKKGLNERKINLDDDFIKFIRMAQDAIDKTSVGALALITNHTYLEGVTHRSMRHKLLESFSRGFILDLHGNTRKAEAGSARCPTSRDENIFDIQQGVAISLFTKGPKASIEHEVRHADIWGDRESKYRQLGDKSLHSTSFATIEPSIPYFFFSQIDLSLREEYEAAPSLVEIFPVHGCGFATSRDAFVTDFSQETLDQRIKYYFDTEGNEDDLSRKFNIRSYRAFSVEAFRRQQQYEPMRIVKFSYRPFDERWVYYAQNIVQEWQRKTMQHLGRQDSITLIAARLIKGESPSHFFVSRRMVEKIFLSNKTSNNAFAFPLFLFSSESAQNTIDYNINKNSNVNLSPTFLAVLAERLGLTEIGESGMPNGLTPEEIFQYVYAVFHSPTYRVRYAEFLKIDFPRLPLTANIVLFRALAALGGDLVTLHLMEATQLDDLSPCYAGPVNPEVIRVGWSNDTIWLDAAKVSASEGHIAVKSGNIGFQGISDKVWNFHIGGYQVCHKWLKDRKGRTLSDDDIIHYQKIIVAISETIRLMGEIDEVIEQHGGWPGAFQTSAD